MNILKALWQDEHGAVVSAELVVVSTVLVGGLTVGLSTLSQAVQAELNDVAGALRSLDQKGIMSGRVKLEAEAIIREPQDESELDSWNDVAEESNVVGEVRFPLWTPPGRLPADPQTAAEFEAAEDVI